MANASKLFPAPLRSTRVWTSDDFCVFHIVLVLFAERPSLCVIPAVLRMISMLFVGSPLAVVGYFEKHILVAICQMLFEQILDVVYRGAVALEMGTQAEYGQ